MRKTVSTRRRHGKREHAGVSTRGKVEVGIIFYCRGEDVGGLEQSLEVVASDLSWNNPDIMHNQKDGNTIVFFPVQLPEEEIEVASNGSVREHLQKVHNINPADLERNLGRVVNDLRSLQLANVTSVSYIFMLRSTLPA